ncbi:hypothetical protein ES702_06403 [subsurface metagenome]
MRSKDEILNDTVKVERGPIPWDSTASIHERLTIEILVDIRDMLHKDIAQIIEDLNFLANKD